MTAADEDARIIAGRYRVLRTLGAGAHGTVDLAEDLLNGGRRVAVKRLEAIVGAGDPEPAAEVLRWLMHPSWAEILDEGRLDEHGRFQVSRYVPGHSLDHVELPRPVDEVLRFLEDGARALRALHRRGLIHYDVTPGNWLREEGPDGPRFTLTDGGLASMGPVRGIARGTPAFMAPEILEGAPHDHRADLYSLGLVAWRLLTGTDPHGTGGAGEVLGRRRRVAAPLLRRVRADAPASLERILAALLERDPERRPADGSALLALLAEAGWARAQDDLLPEEAVTAAIGGGLIGRAEPLARFRAACQAMLTDVAPTPADGTPGPRRSPTLDTVLVVSAPSGSGATRLLREMAAVARGDGIATLALSARDGAADRRSVLRRVADGLGALLGEEASLGGGREGREAGDQHAGSEARATERFVDLCERAAARTPIVLLVEDFAELPPAAQEGLRVLSRHLLARVEHPDGRRPPRFLLVVDHGPDDPAGLLIPDAEDPRRPVVSLPPLAPTEIGALVADRLPGMELPAPDLEALRAASDGLPRTLTALLAEGLRRGDVRRVDARWIWMVDDLRSYRPSRSVPPAVQRALDATAREARAALTRLALLDDAAPEPVALALTDEPTLSGLVAAGLLARSHVGDDVRYAPVSKALRDHLRQQDPEALAGHRTALLAAMSRRPQLDLVPDEARLLADAGDARAALARLSAAAPSLLPAARVRAASIAADLCASAPALLSEPAARLQATSLLVQGPVGNRISDTIAAALPNPPTPADDEVRVRLSEDAFGRSLYARSVELLTPPLASTDPTLTARRAVALLRSRVALDARSVTRKEVAALLRLVRAASKAVPHSASVIVMSLALTRFHYAAGRPDLAARFSAVAGHQARRHRDRSLLVEAFNNRAICLQRLGRQDEAAVTLSRAALLARANGSMRIATRALLNLGRIQSTQGLLLRAVQTLQAALSLALRYADHESSAQVLLALVGIYDAPGNIGLARTATQRAALVATAANNPRLAVESYGLGAELAIQGAHFQAARTALCAAVSTARKSRSSQAREIALGHLMAIRALLGQEQRALQILRRLRDGVSIDDGTIQFLRAVCALGHSRLHSSRSPKSRSGSVAFRRVMSRLLRLTRRSATDVEAAHLAVKHALTSAVSLTGREQRLAAALLLRTTASGAPNPAVRTAWLRAISHRCSESRHVLLAARAEAAVAVSLLRADDTGSALAAVGRSLVALSTASGDPVASEAFASRLRAVPPEFVELHGCLSVQSEQPNPDGSLRQFSWTELHAAAHRRMLAPAFDTKSDTRVASALRVVISLAAQLKTGAGLEALLDSLNAGAQKITGAERSCVVLFGSDGSREIRVVSSLGADGATTDQLPLSQTIIQRVVAARRPLLLHDVFGDSELMARPSIAAFSLRSALCVPLLRGERLYGVMYADSRAGAGSFDNVDLEILSLFAEQASASIETTRLLADVQRSYSELRSAQERLVRGERLRVMGELAGGVAHEFNNLLTAILARLQLLALEPISGAIRRELELIQRAALDAAEVVRRLQNFSRSQRQQDFQRVDVGEICADVVDFLRPLWTARRLAGRQAVTVRLRATKGFVVLGDPTELREVVTNLLKNALEAIDGPGSVVISTSERSGHVTVTVDDDGPGIPAELRTKLFTPFFTTKGEKGTGLGLCLSQQIIERHGGELRLDALPTKGSRAIFSLPLATAASAQPPSNSAEQGDAGQEMKVVIVDDDPNVLDPLCAYLRKSAVRVRGASSAEEALRLLKSAPADLVLTDVGMPGMDGVQLCERLRAEYPAMPVVLMTGRHSTTERLDAATCGAAAILGKPFTMRQVLDLLGRLLERRSSTDGSG